MARSTSSAMELKFWASLMGSAVLMLESGVRVNFQTIFAVAGGAVGLPIFFSRVKPVLSGLAGKRCLQRRRRALKCKKWPTYSSST